MSLPAKAISFCPALGQAFSMSMCAQVHCCACCGESMCHALSWQGKMKHGEHDRTQFIVSPKQNNIYASTTETTPQQPETTPGKALNLPIHTCARRIKIMTLCLITFSSKLFKHDWQGQWCSNNWEILRCTFVFLRILHFAHSDVASGRKLSKPLGDVTRRKDHTHLLGTWPSVHMCTCAQVHCCACSGESDCHAQTLHGKMQLGQHDRTQFGSSPNYRSIYAWTTETTPRQPETIPRNELDLQMLNLWLQQLRHASAKILRAPLSRLRISNISHARLGGWDVNRKADTLYFANVTYPPKGHYATARLAK